jgi:hypothetical protein
MRLHRNLLLAAFGVALTFAGASAASAHSWHTSHPRRAEVNHRLADQEHRINRDLREGRISPRRAAYLHHEDHAIRMQERRDAALDGGHITRGEQLQMNHEENLESRQIHRSAY